MALFGGAGWSSTGGFVFALTLTMALHTYRVTQNNTSKTSLLLITVVFGLSAGALWKVFELAYDWIAMANTNSDFADIFSDLFADAVRALAA